MRSNIIAGAALVAGALSGGAAAAQDIACGGAYTVVRGDTLQLITNRAYGPEKSYQLLYSANRETIGRNPSLIEVGMRLDIPCLDQPAASAPARIEPLQTTGVLPPPTPRALRIVTATDWAPYHDQAREGGGMLVEVLNTALRRVMEPEEYRIDFINDWNAHLQPLLADLAYDFAFSWFRPNCDVVDRLAEGSQFRCRNLEWSDPLFEQVVGYYTRAGEPSPATHRELFGRTLCRPRGYSNFMLEEHELVEPNIRFVDPPSPKDCFRMLVAGEADVVVIATTVADDALAGLGAASSVAEQPQLAAVATLHAVTSVNNPRKAAQLALINDGLRQIREDGTWFEIVQRHLIAHARATAGG